MIKSKRNKAISIFLALAVALAMMPSAAFAETKTWGDGDTEDERNSTVVVDYEPIPNIWLPDEYTNPKGLYTINFKAGELKPFTFYNAYEEIGTRKPDNKWYRNPYEKKLTEKKKELLAKSQLKDWSRIATKIFSSQSRVGGGGGMSGVTWDEPSWAKNIVKDWSDMFENKDLSNIVRINLPDWLCKEDQDSISQEYLAAYTSAAASGFQWADRLSSVRMNLIDDVAEETNHDRKYFENRDNNQGKTLSALDDNTKRDVYYSYVMWRGNELTTKYFNCYGIALYDFQYIPIEGDGLRYSAQSEQYDDNEGGDKVISPLSSVVNEDTNDKRMDVTLEGQKTQTQQNVLGWDERQECSYAYADRFAKAFKDTWPVGYYDVKGVGNFHSALETTREAGKKVEYQTSDKRTVSPIVPAHTLLQVNEMKDKYTYNMMYDAASSLRFKVAIFSLTGSIGELGEVYSRGDFCTEFGAEGSTSANDDANSNLYERAVKRAGSDSTLAKTEGYYKSKKLTNGVDWNHAAFNENVVLGGYKHSVKEVIQDRATRLPMAEVMMQLDLINTIEQQELGATVPLYYLAKFDLSDGLKSEYTMLKGKAYPIDALSVVGKNEYDVVYSGFNAKTDQDLGFWSVADKDPDGNPLDEGIVEIVKDPETGKQKIKAKKAGIAYLTWELKEKTEDGKAIKFTSNDGKTVSATENPPQYPYVKVQVMNESAIPDYIEFDESLPDSIDAIAEESINLHTVLPVNVRNKNKEVIDHSCTYKFENENTPKTDASIDEYGNFIAHKPGKYRIKAEYYGVNEQATPIIVTTTSIENKTINVLEARKLTLVPGGGMGKVAPDKDGIFSLKGNIEYYDQYGEPWTGDIPALKYTLTGSAKCGNDLDEVGKKAKIWGDQLVVNHKNIADGDTFHIKAETKDVTGVEPVSFDYEIEPFPRADIPEAVKGLTYNGKEQTGVKSGEGYTLEGEKAIGAGWHEATATLDSHYKYWKDGSTDTTRKIKYYIDKASVKIPKAKELTYNGRKQTGVTATSGCIVKGNTAVDAGEYTATATLEDKNNYKWEDNGNDKTRTIEWSISAKAITPEITLSKNKYTYNGKVKTPDVTVKDGEDTLTKDKDYTVTYSSGRKNAGKYKVSVTLEGNYSGEAATSFTIEKASNPLKVKGKTASVKYKKLKKKTQTLKVSKVIKFTKKGQGRMSYKKSSVTYSKAKSVKMSKKALKKYKKKVAKKIKINSKTGKVTVKKGLKKGTYKVKAKVKAAGNGNYKSSGWKIVTFKIKVK